jgi:hypothetical protein
MKRWVALGLCTLASTACTGKKDAKIPGNELGTYHVISKLDSSTCGPGALGSPDVWEFDVKLSKDGKDLYWLNGSDPVQGSLAADDVTFSFATEVQVDAVPPGKGESGCSIARSDAGSGTLSSATPPVSGFAGKLRYGFQPLEGSDCQSLIGVAGGFYALPCEINYDMSASKKE